MRIEKEYILRLTDNEMSIIIIALNQVKPPDQGDKTIVIDMLHAIENMPRG